MAEDESGSVRRRSLQGFRWTALQTGVLALIGPLSQVVKARYLLPADLGAVAVLMIIFGLFHTLERAGLSQSIIQEQTLTAAATFTYASAAIVVGIVGSGLMFATAPLIEQLFSVPGSAGLIQLGSPLLLLTMVDQVARSLLHRGLYFRGTSAVEMGRRAVNLLALWILLARGIGPVSVVISMLVATGISSVVLTILVLRAGLLRVVLRVDRSALKHLWTFGSRVGVKQLFTYLTHRADELIVGLTLTPEALGVYHLAKETLDRLRSLITAAFSKVLFPLFSRIRKDKPRLSRVYRRVLLLVSYVGAPVFIGIALAAHLIVPVVFGGAWNSAVSPFRYLAVAMIPIVLTANLSTSLLYALGEARSVLRIEVAINLPYLLALLVASRWGLPAVLAVYVAYCFLKGFVLQHASSRRLADRFLVQLLIVGRALLRLVPVIVVVLPLSLLLRSHISLTLELFLVSVLGVSTYVVTVFLSDRSVFREFALVARG